ncbi:MAG: DUF1802 family protein [Coleofasciculus sp. Co-bin14]|nr:DUF1802 family protein [Coleofasciculus sp. Co-bin14]
MGTSVLLQTALRIAAPDVEALIQGRMIAVMPRKFINPGLQFALSPSNVSINLLLDEQYYRSSFLPIAQTALTDLGSEAVLIKAWARCELCQMLNEPESLEALSRLTIWTTEALQQTLVQRPRIFLAHLRVYLLPQPIEVPVHTQDRQFVPVPRSLSVSETSPVLSDRLFTQRRRQLEKLEPPLHPELEELESAIAQLDNPNIQQLNNEIRQFLGWASNPPTQQLNSQPAWINTITELGNRSKEQDTGKSNYQAGTDFENVVRDSLKFLGFTIDYSHTGGAGGLDLFCSKPYPLVGECKAGRKIPNTTAVQLLNLGTLRLQSKERFRQAAKLIIGPGEPTKQLEEAAEIQGMAIINSETLEKLVKLQSKYRGSVDLFQLKEYLKPGQANDEVEKYIEQVSREIKLRSHLVKLVKNFLENTGLDQAGVDALYGAYFGSNPPQPLQLREMHEILIELSSPLTGYLGRTKGSDWQRDRFYFLRDLQVD